jgi:hypothetical protein
VIFNLRYYVFMLLYLIKEIIDLDKIGIRKSSNFVRQEQYFLSIGRVSYKCNFNSTNNGSLNKIKYKQLRMTGHSVINESIIKKIN